MLDLVAPVCVLKRNAVDEADLAADEFAALKMRDVDPLDNSRRLGQSQRFLQFGQPLRRIENKRLRLPIGLLSLGRALTERAQSFNLIAQSRGLLEIHRLAGGGHLLFHGRENGLPLSVEES